MFAAPGLQVRTHRELPSRSGRRRAWTEGKSRRGWAPVGRGDRLGQPATPSGEANGEVGFAGTHQRRETERPRQQRRHSLRSRIRRRYTVTRPATCDRPERASRRARRAARRGSPGKSASTTQPACGCAAPYIARCLGVAGWAAIETTLLA
ncbi:hypothetical protein ATSB10_01180 [Dyella thiooxydans]|uniref:Uncharacterized protein n=1 Tax=Dyella thiooxydans TaxID=445710 RepID=A0A160MY96_9GAMM|nr:hypothetical protein ATSB10_01180 [Dyella thiooxydans]